MVCHTVHALNGATAFAMWPGAGGSIQQISNYSMIEAARSQGSVISPEAVHYSIELTDKT